MRKITFLFMFLFAVLANSANYFTLGENDSLRIKPAHLGAYYFTDAKMCIDGMIDNFNITITYPRGLKPVSWQGITAGNDMVVEYRNAQGKLASYSAPLDVSADNCEVSAYIPVMGYWDYNYDGVLESYGTAKWMPGTYNHMFTFKFSVEERYRGDWIVFDGHLDAGYDARGAILANVKFYKKVWVWVGYQRGDVDGNELINIGDVTLLIDYVLGVRQLDEFGIAAADVNGDGEVDIQDVTLLIQIVMG